MNRTDQYFTSTIVGQPVTLELGVPAGVPGGSVAGTATGPLSIDLRHARPTMAEHWRDWVLTADTAPAGERWRRPGPVRAWLRRHSVWLAALGWGLALALLAGQHLRAAADALAPGLGTALADHADRVFDAAWGTGAVLLERLHGLLP